MPVFPSVEWFDAIKNIVNNDPAFRQLGTVDATVGVKVEHKIYELKFEAFAIFFSGSKDTIRDGLKIYDEMRRHAVRQYLARLKWATIEREERLNPGLRAFIQTEA